MVSEVFMCQTGQLTASSRRDLKAAGVVVVEVEDPSKCQFIRSTDTIPHDKMLWAALDAVNMTGGSYSKGNEQRERLSRNLLAIVVQSMGLETTK